MQFSITKNNFWLVCIEIQKTFSKHIFLSFSRHWVKYCNSSADFYMCGLHGVVESVPEELLDSSTCSRVAVWTFDSLMVLPLLLLLRLTLMSNFYWITEWLMSRSWWQLLTIIWLYSLYRTLFLGLKNIRWNPRKIRNNHWITNICGKYKEL